MIDPATRRLVRRRADERCEYCRLPQSSAPFVTFHIEHIVAVQHGGNDEAENLCLACPACNHCKGPNLTTIDHETGAIVRLFNPRTDEWDDHFVRIDAEIMGATAVGTATARLLRFNSQERLRVRDELIRGGEL